MVLAAVDAMRQRTTITPSAPRALVVAALAGLLALAGCDVLLGPSLDDDDGGGVDDGAVAVDLGWTPPAGVMPDEGTELFELDTETLTYDLPLVVASSGSPTQLGELVASLEGRLTDADGRREIVFRESPGAAEEVVFPSGWTLPAVGSVGPSGDVMVCANQLTGAPSAATVGPMPDPGGGADLRCRVREDGVWNDPIPIGDGTGAAWLTSVEPTNAGFDVTWGRDQSGRMMGDPADGDGLYRTSVGPGGVVDAPIELETFSTIPDPGLPDTIPTVGPPPRTEPPDWFPPDVCEGFAASSRPGLILETTFSEDWASNGQVLCEWEQGDRWGGDGYDLRVQIDVGSADHWFINDAEWWVAVLEGVDIVFGDCAGEWDDGLGNSGGCSVDESEDYVKGRKWYLEDDPSETLWVRIAALYRGFRIDIWSKEERRETLNSHNDLADLTFVDTKAAIDNLLGESSGECTKAPPGTSGLIPGSAGVDLNLELTDIPPIQCFGNSLKLDFNATAHGLDDPCTSGYSGSGSMSLCTQVACVQDCFNFGVTFGGQRTLEKQCVHPPQFTCDDQSSYCDSTTVTADFSFDRALKAPLNFKLWRFKAGCEMSVSGGGGVQFNFNAFEGPACPCDRPWAGSIRLTQNLTGGGECELKMFQIDKKITLASATVCMNETIAGPDPLNCDHGVALIGGFTIKVKTPEIKVKWFKIKAAVVNWPNWGTGCSGATEL